jgi:glucose/arabinose dehydrogenase
MQRQQRTRRQIRRPGLRRYSAQLTLERLEARHLLTSVPNGFAHERVVTGIAYPTAMEFAPDGRIFVAEKTGAIRVVKDGIVLPQPFTTVDTLSDVEFGLVGLVLDPDFTSNGYVYVNYTTTGSPPRNVIERFTAVGDVAASGSRQAIFQLDTLDPNARHHVGGAMHFGTDGMLYVATGDNNRPWDSPGLGSLHGKMLRIDRTGEIPIDNPFYDSLSGQNRAIWAYGLRNPFTFGIDQHSGTILINDVGGNKWEEINRGTPGAHYGWPWTEGPTSDLQYTGPFYAYAHSSTEKGAAAITGGAFYRPAQPVFPPSYDGKYFFADFNNAWIRALDVETGEATLFASNITQLPLDLDVGPDGALYYLAGYRLGSINRIVYTGRLSPVISSQPAPQRISAGMEARFEVTASGSDPLAYQWQRKAPDAGTFVDIPGARTAVFRIGTAGVEDNGGSYRVVVSNTHGTATSDAAVLTVVPQQPPRLTIVTPAAGTTFRAGQPITFQATAIDTVTGTLPSSAFSWTAEVSHGVVTRPVTSGTGNTGGFVVPDDMPYKRTDVVARLTVTATSAAGLSTTQRLTLQPQIGTLSLATLPAGLQLAIDGEPLTAPGTINSIVGLRRRISAVDHQIVGGVFHRFVDWSNGGAASHVVSATTASQMLTARYVISDSYREGFADAEANDFSPLAGNWLVNEASAYQGAPRIPGGDSVSLLPASVRLPRSWNASVSVRTDFVANASRNGFIIFDYVSPTNFKYAGVRVAAGLWVIGQRTAAGWEDRAALPAAIDPARPLALRLVVDGSVTTLFVDNTPRIQHDFRGSWGGGRLGLGTNNGRTVFDDFVVTRRDEPPGLVSPPQLFIPNTFSVIRNAVTPLVFPAPPIHDVDSTPETTVSLRLRVSNARLDIAGIEGVRVSGSVTARVLTGSIARINALLTSPGRVMITATGASLRDRSLQLTVSERVGRKTRSTAATARITVASISSAPPLPSVVALPGRRDGNSFPLSHEALLAAIRLAQPAMPSTALLVEGVITGRLERLAGRRWVAIPSQPNGSLKRRVIEPGSQLRWLPPANSQSGTVPAFRIRGYDGKDVSASLAEVRLGIG